MLWLTHAREECFPARRDVRARKCRRLLRMTVFILYQGRGWSQQSASVSLAEAPAMMCKTTAPHCAQVYMCLQSMA